MITQSYKLNIVPYAEQTVRGMTSPKVPVSQYDKGLRVLVFDLYDGANGRLTLLDGQTAKIYGKKPDANVFEYDMTVSEDKQSVSIVLQEQMAVIAGCVECEVRIFQGVSTIGSANFTLIVEPAPVGADEVYSESEIPEIDNLLYGGTAGQVFTKTPTGAHWADLGTSSDFMLKSVYDPDDDGSVLKADHADDAGTVDGHTVARDVLANEYTNEQIDSMMQAAGTVKTVNSVHPDQNGNVQIGKSDIGLGNVDNTSDANKPISTATQAALDLKVDKVTGKGLSTNDYTDADKTKLADLPTDAELTAELAGKVDKETGKGLSTNDFTDAEKEKLSGIAAGAEVNVQSDWNEADSTSDAFIQNKPSIPSKTSDLTNDSGFITGVNWGSIGGTLSNQTDLNNELTALNTGLSSAVKSVNDITPDSNGNVEVSASDIPANGMGERTTSGNPIEIEDGVAGNVLDLSVDFEPIQDLHGYDHPWPAGGGKNLLPMTVSDIKSINTGGTWTNNDYVLNGLTFTVNTDDGGNVTGITVTGTASGNTYFDLSHNFDSSANAGRKLTTGFSSSVSNCFIRISGQNRVSLQDVYTESTITDNGSGLYLGIRIASDAVLSNLLFEPMLRLSTESDSSFAPYTNICPISGRTEANVLRRGKNLLPLTVDGIKAANTSGTWNENVYTLNGVTFTIQTDDGGNVTGIQKTGTVPSTTIFYLPMITLAEGSYKMNYSDSSTLTYIELYGKASGGSGVDLNFSISSSETSTPFNCYIVLLENNSENIVYYPMIRLATETDATYEPYQGQSVTVQLGQTVYGGTLDVNTGEFFVNKKYISPVASSWAKDPNGNYYYTTGDYSDADTGSGYRFGHGITNMYVWNPNSDGNPKDTIRFAVGKNRIYIINPSNATTLEELQTVLNTTPLQVVYELATPLTFNLTPAQLALLEGYNVLTTDGDTINLRYIGTEASDVQAEIDEFENVTYKLTTSIAPIERTTAIAPHVVGDYIMLNGEFCKVISAIAVGETITIGTNVSRTTIADELKAIIAQLSA